MRSGGGFGFSFRGMADMAGTPSRDPFRVQAITIVFS